MSFSVIKFLLFFVINIGVFGTPCDSIGIINVKDKKMILYQVEKETLYAISRKYNVSIDLIKKANPELDKGLKVGMKILIPFKEKQSMPIDDQYVLHKIEPNQTMYFISKKYNVSVEEIKIWNNIQTTEMKVGSTIIVGEKTTETQEKIEKQKNSEIAPKENIKPNRNITNNTRDPEAVKSQIGDKIVEKGNAEIFEQTDGNTFYYALHKTLAVGTILQVVNDANNNSIFVRVIGKLTNEGDSRIVIKLTKIAFENLQADKNFKATLEYLP